MGREKKEATARAFLLQVLRVDSFVFLCCDCCSRSPPRCALLTSACSVAQPFCLFLACVEELEGGSESCGENFHNKSACLLEIFCLLLVTCGTEFSQSIGLLLSFVSFIGFYLRKTEKQKRNTFFPRSCLGLRKRNRDGLLRKARRLDAPDRGQISVTEGRSSRNRLCGFACRFLAAARHGFF